jgi:tetrapyrrole methylase family protein / MazG family protein
MKKGEYFEKLIELMDTLRGPNGCPWDREQTRETLKPMLIEEAYEVLEALDAEDPDQLCEELGDLLFQIVFHGRIASERGEFDAYEVCRRVYEKMVRRHPHVFGEASFEDSRDLLRNWEDLKAAEKEARGRPERKKSLLDGVPESLPTIYRTYQMTAKAARVGFDWPDIYGLREKFLEEFDELSEALRGSDPRRIKEEVGDLVFVALNIARYLEIDPETALRGANDKFVRRFRAMEKYFETAGRSLKDVPPQEMELAWQAEKMRADGGDSEGRGT